MNSFQSLLDAYSHLRKRTYKFSCDTLMEASDATQQFQIIMNTVHPNEETISGWIQNLPTGRQLQGHEKTTEAPNGSVIVSEDGTKLNVIGPSKNFGSIDIGLGAAFKEWLEGSKSGTLKRKAAAKHSTGEGQELLSDIAAQIQQQSRDNLARVGRLFQRQGERTGIGGIEKSLRQLEYVPGEVDAYNTLSVLTNHLKTGADITEEDVLEYHQDLGTLLQVFEKYSDDECIDGDDPLVKKARSRFQLTPHSSNRIELSYGQVHDPETGDPVEGSTEPQLIESAMGNAKEIEDSDLEGQHKDKLLNFRSLNVSHSAKTGALRVYAEAMGKKPLCATGDPFLVTNRLTSGYKGSPKVRADLSEPLQVLSLIFMKYSEMPDGPGKERVKGEILHSIKSICKVWSDNEKVAKMVAQVTDDFKHNTSLPLPSHITDFIEHEEMLKKEGLEGGDCLAYIGNSLKKEIQSPSYIAVANSGIAQDVESITKTQNNIPINRVTGVSPPGEGIRNSDAPTLNKGDSAFRITSPESRIKFLKALNLSPEDERFAEFLEDGIVTISDKYVTFSGSNVNLGTLRPSSLYDNPQILENFTRKFDRVGLPKEISQHVPECVNLMENSRKEIRKMLGNPDPNHKAPSDQTAEISHENTQSKIISTAKEKMVNCKPYTSEWNSWNDVVESMEEYKKSLEDIRRNPEKYNKRTITTSYGAVVKKWMAAQAAEYSKENINKGKAIQTMLSMAGLDTNDFSITHTKSVNTPGTDFYTNHDLEELIAAAVIGNDPSIEVRQPGPLNMSIFKNGVLIYSGGLSWKEGGMRLTSSKKML